MKFFIKKVKLYTILKKLLMENFIFCARVKRTGKNYSTLNYQNTYSKTII